MAYGVRREKEIQGCMVKSYFPGYFLTLNFAGQKIEK